MTKNALEKIDSIFMELDELDNQCPGFSGNYELKSNQTEDEFIIQGDIAGLVHLARQVLYVAKSNVSGKHMHFDEYSDLTECNGQFIIELIPTHQVAKEYT